MEVKKEPTAEKKTKIDQADDSKDWQIDPLKGYKKSETKMKKGIKKKQKGDENGAEKMGFDEWSVSWP